MDAKQHEYQLEQWSILIRERLNSGQSVRAWCEENGVTMRKYYYWLKQLRQEHFDEAIQELHASCDSHSGETAIVSSVETPAKAVSKAEINTFVELDRPCDNSVRSGSAQGYRVAAVIRTHGMEVDIFSDTPEECLRRLFTVFRDA